MSPEAADMSPSPEPGTDHEPGTASETNRPDHESTDGTSPDQMGKDGAQSAKANAKDPSRPRRKKARRACFACQRAHLTCGDERPCNRCIKRGLQDQCHDGVRKKAKYLHDAPNEALNPNFQGNLHSNGSQPISSVQRPSPSAARSVETPRSGSFYAGGTPAGFQAFGASTQQGPMGPPLLDTSNLSSDFSGQRGADNSHRFSSVSTQQLTPSRDLPTPIEQPSLSSLSGNPAFDQSYLDPTDPNYYNFNLNVADLNFGNHYGALEFGMLGHIASGAVDTSELEALNPMGQANQGIGFDQGSGFASTFGYNASFPSWQSVPNMGSRQSSGANLWASQNNNLEAYAIGEHAPSLTASSPKSQDFNGFQTGSPDPTHQADSNPQQDLLRLSHHHARKAPFPGDPVADTSRKRKRDTSHIYQAVKKPYSYTAGFHALTDYLSRNFTPSRVLAIAKALATVRPSFIACNKNLTQDDLVFTEQAFQRAICEYKDTINNTSTPTIVCRRTGEIAVVSKEFTLMTDWRKEVLLGQEPNFNANTGSNASRADGAIAGRTAATPRLQTADIDLDPERTQAVFIAELMDENSVVGFYQDFAEIAFGASRNSVVGERCTLLKYRPQSESAADDDWVRARSANGRKEINDESGMKALGGRDGKIECSMCWTVKRDIFDMPLLIVFNFLPITGN